MKLVAGIIRFDERTPLSVYNDFLWDVGEAVPGLLDSTCRLSAELVFETSVSDDELVAFEEVLSRYTPYTSEILVDIYATNLLEHIHRIEGSE